MGLDCLSCVSWFRIVFLFCESWVQFCKLSLLQFSDSPSQLSVRLFFLFTSFDPLSERRSAIFWGHDQSRSALLFERSSLYIEFSVVVVFISLIWQHFLAFDFVFELFFCCVWFYGVIGMATPLLRNHFLCFCGLTSFKSLTGNFLIKEWSRASAFFVYVYVYKYINTYMHIHAHMACVTKLISSLSCVYCFEMPPLSIRFSVARLTWIYFRTPNCSL